MVSEVDWKRNLYIHSDIGLGPRPSRVPPLTARVTPTKKTVLSTPSPSPLRLYYFRRKALWLKMEYTDR